MENPGQSDNKSDTQSLELSSEQKIAQHSRNDKEGDLLMGRYDMFSLTEVL